MDRGGGAKPGTREQLKIIRCCWNSERAGPWGQVISPSPLTYPAEGVSAVATLATLQMRQTRLREAGGRGLSKPQPSRTNPGSLTLICPSARLPGPWLWTAGTVGRAPCGGPDSMAVSAGAACLLPP